MWECYRTLRGSSSPEDVPGCQPVASEHPLMLRAFFVSEKYRILSCAVMRNHASARLKVNVKVNVEQKRHLANYAKCLFYLVRSERVELPTYWFVASCSIQLSYERNEGVI